MTNIAMENPLEMVVLIGKSSINGPFSMAILNNQRVSSKSVQEPPLTSLVERHKAFFARPGNRRKFALFSKGVETLWSSYLLGLEEFHKTN